jgi:HK97 family phage prohead protease
MEPNFSGYVSKANLKCADGRTIMPGAFAHQDGLDVPLVYQHNHEDINQVLGHVILKNKEDGLWGDVYLNDTVSAKNADALVKHGDIKKFSIWAKNLVERNMDVIKGDVQEVSLVLAGANAGANISNYQNVLAHAGLDEEDVLLIVGGEIVHSDTGSSEPKQDTQPALPQQPAPATGTPAPEDKPAEGDTTVADVLGTLSDEQRTAVNSVIDDIVTEAVTEALTEEPTVQHDNIDSSQKGTKMARNVFDRSKNENTGTSLPELKHGDMVAVLDRAKTGQVNSLRELIRSQAGKELMHADTYGIDNIEVLFPDAQALMRTPVFVDRRQEWVKVFMAGTSHSPFSRVKTMHADITADEARARGYIKAGKKVEEVFPVFKRTTGPALVYKKQKLDRQDIIDITDFDVVAWMKVEMRGKLDEEVARAALFGDGRPTMVNGELNPDKIQDPGGDNNSGDGIRAIVNDNDLYTTTYDVPLAADATGTDWNILMDTAIEAGEFYRGSGNKTAFVTFRTATRLLTIRDSFQKRIYRNLAEVAGDMEVDRIVRVPTELFPTDVLMVVLDLSDYNFGTNAGGEVTLFDDFDIDFNQYKYLMETYLSGALTLPFSAEVYRRVDTTDTLVVPTEPAVADNVITIPTQTGVSYFRTDTGAEVADASTITLDADALPIVQIEARPDANYYFGDNLDQHDSWTFEYVAP